MPELTEEQIREEIVEGRLSLLSIDTNIFDRYNHGLEHGLLKRLSQFVGTEVNIVLSEIVLRELRKHMVEAATSAETKLAAALKAMGGSWNIAPAQRVHASAAVLQGKTAETAVADRIEAFQRSTGFEAVGVAALVDIAALVDRYFESRPPFAQKDDKKHEFPDALALMSLERFATDADTLMLAVSEDKGWAEFCKDSQRLVCVADLGTAMSYFQRLPLVVSARLATRLHAGEVPHLTDAIHRALQDHVDGTDFYVEANAAYSYEEEIEEKSVQDVEYLDEPQFIPVEQDDERFVFETTVFATVQVTCGFSFSVKDGIDRDYVPLGSATATVTEQLPFSLTITIEGDPEGEFDVIEVEVIQSETTIDFGYVEPDFGDPDY